MPRVLRVDPVSPDRSLLSEAADVLRRGGLVAFPTETVYGLGASAESEAAVARVFEAKGRPPTHPLILHVDGTEAARASARVWPGRAEALAAAFWPGPLTLVLERAARVCAAVAGGGDSVAVRVPAHPVARALLALVGHAVAAPSANRYQGLSPTTAAHVVRQLGDRVDLVVDAGPADAGMESTVVDVRGDVAVVLRPGAVDLAALRAVAPDVRLHAGVVAEPLSRPSPGMDERHYSPRARMVVAPTAERAFEQASRLASAGDRAGLLVREPWRPREQGADPRLLVRVLPGDAAGYARAFYAALHALDEAGADVIIVEQVPTEGPWWAVADRLRRGCAPVGSRTP
jgi:L-threonylcarbamoyladenylate synthase